MDRKQKLKLLNLVSQGTPIKQAIEVVLMPEIMVVFDKQEAEQIKASGYDGKFIILVDKADLEA